MNTLEHIIKAALTGEIDFLSPVFEQMKQINENDNFHDNDTIYDHTIRVMENLRKITSEYKPAVEYFESLYVENSLGGNYKRKDLLFAGAVFHDTGKVKTYSCISGTTSCPGHEAESVIFTGNYLRDIADWPEAAYILDIIRRHGEPHRHLNPDNAEIDSDFDRFEKDSGSIYPDLLFFVKADVSGSQLEILDNTLFKFITGFLDKRIEKFFNS